MEKLYGLVGKKLSHSPSPFVHDRFAKSVGILNYNYQKFELSEDMLEDFFKNPDFGGVNITIPYKVAVMKYCDKISDIAKEIGCVNLIYSKNGKLYGDNCDYYGLKKTFVLKKIIVKDKKVLILGTGGTSLTSYVFCKNQEAKEIQKVSRRGKLNYENIYDQSDTEIIINTTPSGMYPDNEQTLIDLSKFPKLYAVVDVVPNPLKTRLILQAEKLGLKFSGGLPMLVYQAKKGAEILMGIKQISDETVNETLEALVKINQNIILIGMPGCGKTSVGNMLKDIFYHEIAPKELVDIDDEIEKQEKISIPDIFAAKGEEYFRFIEKECVSKFGKEHGLIISTGGGTIIDHENILNLKQNGVIFYIKRNIADLEQSGRPLSKNLSEIEKIYNQRASLYEKSADFIVDNNSDIKSAAEKIFKIYKNITSSF
ncbi:MAG: shikimate dehydrogenase [Eubacterium sp.]|nr:shikimate dehydrogenase [Eubacterium sp.]